MVLTLADWIAVIAAIVFLTLTIQPKLTQWLVDWRAERMRTPKARVREYIEEREKWQQ